MNVYKDIVEKAIADATTLHKKYYTKYYATGEIPPPHADFFSKADKAKNKITAPTSDESLEVDLMTKSKAPAKKVSTMN